MLEKKKTLAQAMGITRTVNRPAEEADIKLRDDRIGRYFEKYLKKFVFAEFSKEFLARSNVRDIMKGVPIPLRKEDLKVFAGGAGLDATHIAESMAWIIGSNPKFRYRDEYIQYLMKIFNHKIYEGMMKKGRDAAEKEDFDRACIYFRASLCMKPDYIHSMYSYARVCRAMYLASRDGEYVGRFKAEALEYFELLTETHPRFAQGYYYLGYGYLNLGLYSKAEITWRSFLKFSQNGKDKKEIRQRLEQIKEPVEIEAGINEVMATRFEKGLSVLEPFLEGKFSDWWPLHYYVGVAYSRTGNLPAAVSQLKKVLAKNPSHLETMVELMDIYEAEGDKDNYKKYKKKVELVEESLEDAIETADDQSDGKEDERNFDIEDKIKIISSDEDSFNNGKALGNSRIPRLKRH